MSGPVPLFLPRDKRSQDTLSNLRIEPLLCVRRVLRVIGESATYKNLQSANLDEATAAALYTENSPAVSFCTGKLVTAWTSRVHKSRSSLTSEVKSGKHFLFAESQTLKG